MRRPVTNIVATAFVLALASCGGDGGGGNAKSTTTTTTTARYPANVEANFMTNCERTSKGNTKGCRCILDRLEATMTLTEFTTEDQRVAKGHEPSRGFTGAVDACR